MSDQPLTWISTDTMVVGVSPAGLVRAAGGGTAAIVAISGAVADTVTVVVRQVAATLGISPDSAVLTAQGATVQLAATVLDSTGHAIPGLPVSWTSGDASIATVDNTGLVRAVANGSASVTASTHGATGTALVTVSIPDSVIAVVIDIKPGRTPNSINLGSNGDTPVAILTTATSAGEPVTFDASTVVPESVQFAGVSARHWALEDVDGDGDVDLILQFDTQRLELTATSTSATLTARTSDGRLIRGQDSVSVTGLSSASGRNGQ